MKKTYFIIDFDSTFIKSEGLDELAAIVLKSSPRKKEVLDKIRSITRQGMEGKISFSQSLKKRLALLSIEKKDIKAVTQILKKQVTVSIRRNRAFFKKHSKQVYIVSGGFSDYIRPVVSQFGIDESHVLANSFRYDKSGKVIGIDEKNPLGGNNGKTEAIKSLKLDGEIQVVGDGHTDWQIRKSGSAKKFIAFTENILRDKVVKKADLSVADFDDFLFHNKLPASYSYPKSRIKVLLLDKVDPRAVDIFKEEGYNILPPDAPLQMANIVTLRSRTKLTQPVLQETNRLITVGRFGIGVDNIDLKTASDRGIAVFNAPYSNTRSVVEFVVGLILALARRIPDKNNLLRQGVWNKDSAGHVEIRGKTLGIIGYGNIGSQLSTLCEGLGMKVVFYDILDKMPLGNAQRLTNFKHLLKKSDFLSVHLSGNPKKPVLGRNEFSLMKQGAYLINTSRGGAIDYPALIEVLKQGRLNGAALDVFPNEPKSKEEKFTSGLVMMPNVILTPHIAGATVESQKNIAEFVCRKIIDYINHGSSYLSVNLPNIQLAPVSGAHRLLHIHKNVPNMLAQINTVLGQHGINILGQYLKTNETVGYLITDVNKQYDSEVIEKLKKIPDTIRFRLLY